MLVLVAACVALAWPADSPLVPADGGAVEGDRAYAWAFLALLVLAFAAYLVGLRALAGARVRRSAVVGLAVAVQLVPLAAPPLLSTDVYTYWVYGEIARAGGNPYRDTPEERRDAAGFDEMGAKWRDQTSVYGPAFTVASEAAATSRAWLAAAAFKVAAAAALLAVVLLAARRSTFGAAFVGWNPAVAVHVVGGGHNDAWLAALVVAAVVLRPRGAGVAWAAAALVKWVPLVLVPLRALETRSRRGEWLAFGMAALVGAAVATWLFGLAWLRAAVPLAHNAADTTSYSLPHRLSQLGVPEGLAIALAAGAFAVAYLWLARQAWRGRARLALAMGLLLLCAPYVTPWYLAWVVPLAAIEEDRTARVLALALTAYLLPQTVPV